MTPEFIDESNLLENSATASFTCELDTELESTSKPLLILFVKDLLSQIDLLKQQSQSLHRQIKSDASDAHRLEVCIEKIERESAMKDKEIKDLTRKCLVLEGELNEKVLQGKNQEKQLRKSNSLLNLKLNNQKSLSTSKKLNLTTPKLSSSKDIPILGSSKSTDFKLTKIDTNIYTSLKNHLEHVEYYDSIGGKSIFNTRSTTTTKKPKPTTSSLDNRPPFIVVQDNSFHHSPSTPSPRHSPTSSRRSSFSPVPLSNIDHQETIELLLGIVDQQCQMLDRCIEKELVEKQEKDENDITNAEMIEFYTNAQEERWNQRSQMQNEREILTNEWIRLGEERQQVEQTKRELEMREMEFWENVEKLGQQDIEKEFRPLNLTSEYELDHSFDDESTLKSNGLRLSDSDLPDVNNDLPSIMRSRNNDLDEEKENGMGRLKKKVSFNKKTRVMVFEDRVFSDSDESV